MQVCIYFERWILSFHAAPLFVQLIEMFSFWRVTFLKIEMSLHSILDPERLVCSCIVAFATDTPFGTLFRALHLWKVDIAMVSVCAPKTAKHVQAG